MREMNERLAELKVKIIEKERLKKTLKKAMEQRDAAENKMNNMRERLKKEKADVEKLEKLTISNFLHTVSGRKQEKYEKETEEFISIKVSFDSAAAEVDNLIKSIQKIKARIDGMGDVEQQYNRLIEEKERLLVNQSDGFKERLNNIINEETRLAAEGKEVIEAVRAGKEVLCSIDRVMENLNSAGNWGTWDVLGGGLIATMAKHSKIDEAQQEINNIRFLIKKFHSELEDIGREIDLSIEIGSFLTFADYMFDGLFADLAVQSKIRDAQKRVEDTRCRVEAVLKDLGDRLNRNHRRLEDLKNERVNLVEGV